ncbi:hypothetical protein C9374_006939 [Naegleria lovaniensis]|uniref:Tyrosyl-DNA phosphodiesterase n=1 Tax=Naegleria lovaniensis TaxID=51637 RepID=A0AA88GYK1_NAELO|nr:uncharacterized protein C9374_006939 [Naegleria lovaniensis]KAG2393408.1 hypothetical protein C9374_006939 [Naegleria lovaniensis]
MPNPKRTLGDAIIVVDTDDDTSSEDDDQEVVEVKHVDHTKHTLEPITKKKKTHPSQHESVTHPKTIPRKAAQTSSLIQYHGDKIYYNPLANETSNSEHFLTLSQILEVRKAKSLFLSSFCLDYEFLQTVIPFESLQIPITISHHWDQTQEKVGKSLIQLGKCPICVCNPKLLGQYSNMHAKLFIIEFEEKIRIVISSANLTQFDWQYFKQAIWIQEFPKKLSTSSCKFENDLVDFWQHLTGLPGNFLRKYDYSTAKGELIPSIPGYHTTDKYGHLAIKKSIAAMNFSTTEIQQLKDSPLYFQMSSIGSMNSNYIAELSDSFYVTKTKNLFHIVFPSLDVVSQSHYGLRCGGMIHLRSKTYETSTFPRNAMSHYSPTQGNHLSHSKIIFHQSNNNPNVGFIVIGSHNLSQAALGKLQKNNSQLYISNYELGIALKLDVFKNKENMSSQIPRQSVSSSSSSSSSSSQGHALTNEQVQSQFGLILPFKIPPTRYDHKHDSPFILENVQDLYEN